MNPRESFALAKTKCEMFAEGINELLNCISVTSVFTIHFVLTVGFLLVCESSYVDKVKPVFAFYNGFFLLTLFLSVSGPPRPVPIQLATMSNFLSIVFDVFIVVKASLWHNWILVPSIVLRPITSLILLRKCFAQKRAYNLNQSQSTSLLVAIKSLLFQNQIDEDLLFAKTNQVPPTAAPRSTLPPTISVDSATSRV